MLARFLVTLLVLTWPIHARSEVKTIIVGFAAGGSSSIIARALAQALDTNIVVENMPGANGVLAAQHIVREKSNSTVLVMSSTSIARIPYELNLMPIAQICEFDYVFAVGSSVKSTDLASYLASLSASNERLLYSIPGFGSLSHVLGYRISAATGLEISTVPHQGSNPAVVSVLGGHVPATIVPVPDFLPYRDQLKALATFGVTRSVFLPTVPTAREQRLNIIARGWMSIFGHPEMPHDAALQLQDQVTQAVARIAVAAWPQGFTRSMLSGKEFGVRYRQEHEELDRIFKLLSR